MLKGKPEDWLTLQRQWREQFRAEYRELRREATTGHTPYGGSRADGGVATAGVAGEAAGTTSARRVSNDGGAGP